MQTDLSKGETISAGVDWITATSKGKGGYDAFSNFAEEYLSEECDRGNRVKRTTVEGYSGFASGSVFAGALNGIMLMRLSSHQAYNHWRTIVPSAGNISRLDVQVTKRYEWEPSDRLGLLERRALKYKRAHNLKHEVELRRNDKRGTTLYTGARVSDRYGRAYDKGKESGEPIYNRCLRLELELKRKYAVTAAVNIMRQPRDADGASTLVSRYFNTKGLYVGDGTLGPQWSSVVSLAPRSDVGRSLTWLRQQIRPTVERLIQAGELEQCLDALGLSGYVITLPPGERGDS